MIDILATHIVGTFLLILGCLFAVGGLRMWDEYEEFLTVSCFCISGLCIFFSLVFFDVIRIVVE